MKKSNLWTTLAICCALGLAALAGSSCRTQSRAADDKSKIHVGIVFDIGGKDDRSFNAAAWEGAKCAAT
ncbi:MAG: BMP family ABC transporter substrate-binding protein, partial [Pyrinomonadaceae bacterium]|nr:BMP family ABC transporter substrate-binding protein [Pyrinomonadaceae bacterium]